MSDRISAMAKPTEDERDEILVLILRHLKSHSQALLELTGDAEGLKATMSGFDHEQFGPAREMKLHEYALSSAGEIRVLDEAIQRLRDT
jgi:hypothetical protein